MRNDRTVSVGRWNRRLCLRGMQTAAWILPLMLAVGEVSAHAQDAHSSPSNAKWAQEWRKQWLAKHGGAASAHNKAKAGQTPDTASSDSAPQTLSASGKVSTAPAGPSTQAAAPAQPSNSSLASPSAQALPSASRQALPTPSGEASSTGAANKTPATTASATTTALPPAPAAGNRPAAASTPQNPKSKTQSNDILAQTRPDMDLSKDPAVKGTATGDHTQDSPMASVGDSWKMIAYLLPVLLVIIGGLNLLKRFQARTGYLPGALQSASRGTGGVQSKPTRRTQGGLWNAILGGFHLNNARQAGGSSIRLLESVPLGGANVHLLEVRGRVLLLGASAAGLNLLTEFDERGGAASTDFRDLLHAAAADMDAMDYEQEDLPATATVSTLEDLMRETRSSVTKNARRLRTVREVEGEDD